MPNRSLESLYTEFTTVAARGDEQALKNFLITNLKEFPEEQQDEIITAFVEDALDKQLADGEAILSFQKKGIELFKRLEMAKEKLEHKDKLLEIKESVHDIKG